MKKKLSIILIVSIVIAMMAGCGQAATSTVKSDQSEQSAQTSSTSGAKTESITFMYQGTEQEQGAIKAVAEKFKSQTGINVVLNFAPHDVYQEQLSGAITSKKMPDVVQLDAPFLSSLVWAGALTPLEQYIDKDILEDMTASNIAQCTYPIDNKLYAMSNVDSTVLLYANKKYLEQIGARIPKSVEDAWTIEEFETYLEKLSKISGVKYPLDIMRAYGVKSEWGTYGFYPAMISAGGGIIDPKTNVATGTLNSEISINALEKFQTWANKGWIVPASAGDNLLFNEKREAAIAWSGNWYWSQAYPTLGEDLIALPLPNFGQGVRSPNGTWIFGISEASSNKEAAGKLISFMLKDPDYVKMEMEESLFPGLKSWAAKDPLYSDPNKMQIASQQSNTAVARPQHPAYPVITGTFMEAFANILDGADVKSTLDQAAKLIDEDIVDHDGYPPFGK